MGEANVGGDSKTRVVKAREREPDVLRIWISRPQAEVQAAAWSMLEPEDKSNTQHRNVQRGKSNKEQERRHADETAKMQMTRMSNNVSIDDCASLCPRAVGEREGERARRLAKHQLAHCP